MISLLAPEPTPLGPALLCCSRCWAIPITAASEGQGQLSRSHDLGASSPLGHPMADKGEGQLSHTHTLGWLTHTPTNGVSSTLLPRESTGPTLPSAAASERKSQISHSHYLRAISPACCRQQEAKAEESISPLPKPPHNRLGWTSQTRDICMASDGTTG